MILITNRTAALTREISALTAETETLAMIHTGDAPNHLLRAAAEAAAHVEKTAFDATATREAALTSHRDALRAVRKAFCAARNAVRALAA